MIKLSSECYEASAHTRFSQAVWRIAWIAWISVLALLLIGASVCFGQAGNPTIASVRTDSPRQTFESFIALKNDLESALLAYRNERSESTRDRITRIGDEFLTLIDLSSVPGASRRKRGAETGAALLDILGRIDLPAISEIPEADRFDTGSGRPARWRIPDTPIEIVRMRDGPREGEFLFAGRTVD